MKRNLLLLMSIAMLLLTGCFGWGGDDDIDGFPANSPYEPVIMERSEFETSTSFESTPRAIENSGKIYVKGNYIFINEVNKGFHIINNTDPTNPASIGFIKVLGSSDLSIKDDVFYVNNATDLVAFKLNEDSETLTITKRLPNVFPQIWTPEGPFIYPVEDNEIIIDWQLVND